VAKRPHPQAPDQYEKEGPRLSLATSLPPSVWQEHLRRFLSIKEAAGLRAVCKALKVLVREWPMALWGVHANDIEAALKCFPATESFDLVFAEGFTSADETYLVEVLRERGRALKTVFVWEDFGRGFLSSAVRAGALPNLTYFKYFLKNNIDQQNLSGGMLRLLEKVDVAIHCEKHLAALEHLRRLPHLQGLNLICEGPLEAEFPPFVPSSLKTLMLKFEFVANLEALLRGLPSILQASGARLEKIHIRRYHGALSAPGGAALAQVLQICSSTIKKFQMFGGREQESFVCIRELLPGLMSCCDTLEVLHCPWNVLSAFPASCPRFTRLNELHLNGYSKAISCSSTAWSVMANGRLPALATLVLETTCRSLWAEGQEEGGCRLADAFEALGGTLEGLRVGDFGCVHMSDGASYELGGAIGKLRRLKSLQLTLNDGGAVRTHHGVGRGLAASGGCPELRKLWLHLVSNLSDFFLEPSLIVPSVRDFRIAALCTEEEALLLCCGLVQVGYKHSFDDRGLLDPHHTAWSGPVRACMRAILQGGGVGLQ
jgi:hypothetical protein